MGELKGTVVGEGFLMMFSRQEQTEVNNRRGAMRELCAPTGAALPEKSPAPCLVVSLFRAMQNGISAALRCVAGSDRVPL